MTLADYEHLRYLNHVVFKDDVLEEFMQRAEDLDKIAGTSAIKDTQEKVPAKKPTAQEIAELAKQRDPHRFYTNTPFRKFMGLTAKAQSGKNR